MDSNPVLNAGQLQGVAGGRRAKREELPRGGAKKAVAPYIAAKQMLESILLVLLCIHVLLALWATIRTARSDLSGHRRTVAYIASWVMPVIGPIDMLVKVSRHERGVEPATSARPMPVPIGDPAPEYIELPGREPFAVTRNTFNGHEFPILDWEALDKWAGDGPPEVKHEGIARGRRAWLAHFRDTLAGTHLLETRDAWVLSSYEPGLAKAVAAYVSTTRGRILRLLEGIARFAPEEKSIFVALDSQEQYYQYVANYYPEDGEFSFSGGMYINFGCPHFVTVKDELWRLEPVIAHEMTHSAVAHLRLPLWLDEGIAVTTEHHISEGNRRHHRDQVELIGKHLEFWNAERMQEFWSGESFQRTDEGNSLSYDLATQIVGLAGRQWDVFVKFATGAQREDGGAAAARTALNLDLGRLAAMALNVAPQPGWSPDPGAWKNAPRKR
jgi:hypothetical protein